MFVQKIFDSDVQLFLIKGLEMDDEVNKPFYAYVFETVNAY